MILQEPLEKYFYLNKKQKFILQRAKINTVENLLRHFPNDYKKFVSLKKIRELKPNEEARIKAKILSSELKRSWKKRIPVVEFLVQDETGLFRITWFNQPYLAKTLKQGEIYYFTGKIYRDKAGSLMINPIWDLPAGRQEQEIEEEISGKEKFYPVYSEIYGLSSRWIAEKIKKLLFLVKDIDLPEILPKFILQKYHLPDFKTGVFAAHQPKNPKHFEAVQKRFSFEEIFLLQLSRLKEKISRKKLSSFEIKISRKEINSFIKSFDFKLTGAQEKAIKTILEDLSRPEPMARLLEGDVGSGKTIAAIAISRAVVKSGYQIAYMAPTEILARQIYEEFIKFFRPLRVKIGLLTSSQSRKYPSKAFPNKDAQISKNQLLKWVLGGEIPILIGTHSLTYEKVKFNKLGLVIIDEQHRFGIKQRGLLAKKTSKELPVIPHLLSMTATPIPRTLALTIYGDLDLTLLDEMPPGRKKIKTIIVPPEQRKRAYEMMREEIKTGRQAYVVCPRIENQKSPPSLKLRRASKIQNFEEIFHQEPEEEIKAVKSEYKRLSEKVFPEFKLGILHGRLLPKEKEDVIKKFKNNEIQILASTSVIEVGINIPNATMILIEGAERFGLSQLHQLRGRVLRSVYQPYCFIFTEHSSQKILDRLNALTQSQNGFELAEYDLKFRGAGELTGTKQWGISDIGMIGLKNLKMVEAARTEAMELLKKDFELKNFPLLSEAVKNSSLTQTHLE